MLNVIMLNVIMLSVVTPRKQAKFISSVFLWPPHFWSNDILLKKECMHQHIFCSNILFRVTLTQGCFAAALSATKVMKTTFINLVTLPCCFRQTSISNKPVST
jgi:hypothetical protein